MRLICAPAVRRLRRRSAPLRGADFESDQAFCDAARLKCGAGYLALCGATAE